MSKIPVAKIKIKINGKGHSRQRKREQDTNLAMGKGYAGAQWSTESVMECSCCYGNI